MQPRPYDPDELAEMFDEYDSVCEETYLEKRRAVTAAINRAPAEGAAELKTS